MADRWEELLPFYVAGTLDPAKRAALERHMDGCTTCRRALNEWILISEGVRAEADSWVRTLPLPRYGGQFGTAPPQRSVRAVRQRPLALATMAASFLAVLILGGILVYMASRVRPNNFAAPSTGEVAVNPTEVAATQTALADALAPASPTSTDLGLITNTPILTPTFVIEFLPTATPVPTLSSGFGGGGSTPLPPQPTQTLDNALIAGIETTPLFGCMARATSPDGARIYRTPDTFGEVVDTLGAGDFLVILSSWAQIVAECLRRPLRLWRHPVCVEDRH
jgi:Putative zinc-finger